MLCLTLLPGEYLTIGSDVVVQLDRMSGDHCKLAIHAPREVPILRGEVLERDGGERPGCVFDARRRYRRELPWDRSKAQALSAMRLLLEQMDSADENVPRRRKGNANRSGFTRLTSRLKYSPVPERTAAVATGAPRPVLRPAPVKGRSGAPESLNNIILLIGRSQLK